MTNIEKDYLIAITRVNVVKKWDQPDPEAYRSWIQTRINYINMFSANSVRNNYEKPLFWLVLIDRSAIHDSDMELLESAVKGTPFKFVDTNGGDIISAIKSSLTTLEFPCRITTCRFDSDDLISNDYFASLKAFLAKDEISKYPALISQPGGAVYINSQEKFYYSAYPDNPFLSLSERVETIEDLMTVYCAMHTEIHNKASEVHMLRSHHPMWASVVQGDNIANESLLNGCEVILTGEILYKRFGLAPKINS